MTTQPHAPVRSYQRQVLTAEDEAIWIGSLNFGDVGGGNFSLNDVYYAPAMDGVYVENDMGEAWLVDEMTPALQRLLDRHKSVDGASL